MDNTYTVTPPPTDSGKKKHKGLKIFGIVILVLVVLGVISKLAGGSSNTASEATTTASASQTQDATEDSQMQETTEDNVPTEYKNALEKAKTYSDMMYMSKQGIYDQLTSEAGEQFPADAAQYAIDNLQADYNKNALEKAKTYQNDMNMSKQAIKDQLMSSYGEKFTESEAQYAIDNLG